MNRRRYLVTYDISDDKRRLKVFLSLRARGDHTQFSVFLCDLGDRELVRLRGILEEIVKKDEDQVLFADLGPAEKEPGKIIGSVGRPYQPPIRALVV